MAHRQGRRRAHLRTARPLTDAALAASSPARAACSPTTSSPALRAAGDVVTALGRADLDITDAGASASPRSRATTSSSTAAAYTAVDAAETDEASAFAVNAVGAANVARACSRAGARLVHISTDYVFDGDATEPYAVDHPLAPRSAYGRTKAAGEWAVQAPVPRVVDRPHRVALRRAAARTSSRPCCGSPASARPSSVVDDQVGQPTWTVDLADLVVRLVAADAPYGIHHGTRGRTTWYGLARAVFEVRGLDPERVQPTTSAALALPAPRPVVERAGPRLA